MVAHAQDAVRRGTKTMIGTVANAEYAGKCGIETMILTAANAEFAEGFQTGGTCGIRRMTA